MPKRYMTGCSVAGCLLPFSSKGLCSIHYQRQKKYGSFDKPVRGYGETSCSIPDCKLRAQDNKMCGMHAQRVRRYGDPSYVTPNAKFRERCREGKLGLRIAKATTYKKFFNRHEHRVVAEKKLGRKLMPGEIVHHIDRNRHNNAPENLEVMSQSEHAHHHSGEMWAARVDKHGH